MKEHTFYNVINFQDKSKAWALKTINDSKCESLLPIYEDKGTRGKKRLGETISSQYNIITLNGPSD